MVPALKLPLASRLTIALAVFALAAALAAVAPLATSAAEAPPTVATVFVPDGPVTSPPSTMRPPTPGILPLASRLTIVLGVFAVVAAFAALAPVATFAAATPAIE